MAYAQLLQIEIHYLKDALETSKKADRYFQLGLLDHQSKSFELIGLRSDDVL